MRIIAGQFRGRTLAAPKGDGTRPTTDRVRESLMSALVSLRDGLDGAVVLDAQDVGALPAPVAPQAGALLRVLSIRSDGSLVVDTVTPAALKTLLEAT